MLKACILSTAPQMIRDRKYHLTPHESCLVGSEMVDWLIHLSPLVHSRSLAIGMWQALLEEGAIAHGTCLQNSFLNSPLSQTAANLS